MVPTSSLRAHSSWHAQYLLRVLDLIFNTSDRSTTVSNCRLFQTRLSPTAIFQGTEHEQLRERECVYIWHFSALGAKQLKLYTQITRTPRTYLAILSSRWLYNHLNLIKKQTQKNKHGIYIAQQQTRSLIHSNQQNSI